MTLQETYEQVAESTLPDHWKSGYTEDDFRMRRLAFTSELTRIITRMRNTNNRQAPLTVLDVGCGNGAYTVSAVDAGCTVFGVDISKALVKESMARCPAIRGCVASCYDLPFPDGAFDIVYSLGLLQAVADGTRYLGELVRVLKPDGVGLIEFMTKWNLLDACARATFHLMKLDWRSARADCAWLKTAGPVWRGLTVVRTSPREVRRTLLRSGAAWARDISKRWLIFNSHYTTVLFSRSRAGI